MSRNRFRAPPDETDDLRVMEGVAAGDQDAFQALLDRFWARLVLFARSVVLSGDVAEDVVQTVFVRVWERRHAWEPTGTVAGYLFRLARNEALNERRNSLLRIEREHGASDERPRDFRPSPLDAMHIRTEVLQAIARLPERRREVFVLSRFHGLSHGEISEVMGISAQTVSNQMSSALDDLRDALAHLREGD